MRKRLIVRLAWGLALTAAFVMVIDAFVCGVYRVDSGSMEPTLHGPDGEFDGERVLVFYDNSPKLERFDLVVFLPDGEKEPIVKRVVGLPGESVQIVDGGLMIDGSRLHPLRRSIDGVTVFDDREMPMEHAFPEIAKESKHVDGMWDFRREDVRVPQPIVVWLPPDDWDPSTSSTPTFSWRMEFQPRVFDGYRSASGRFVDGTIPASDLVLRFDFLIGDREKELRATLTERGDLFDVILEPLDGGRALMTLRHGTEPNQQREFHWDELVRATVELSRNAWHSLELANVANAVTATLDHQDPPLVWTYESNTPLKGRADATYLHLLPRASIMVDNFDFALRHIQILRGIEYTHEGTHGVDGPLQLGPDEIFVLGDNSSASRDSRNFGPVKLSTVIGRPGAVVSPWRNIRRLHGAAEVAQSRR